MCVCVCVCVCVYVCAHRSHVFVALQDKQLRDVGDWRKNIEDKSDRKKMFDS